MAAEFEPMQQPIRKAVGRPPTNREQVARVQELTTFIRKYAPGVLERTEGDYYPVRKVVGRPRKREG